MLIDHESRAAAPEWGAGMGEGRERTIELPGEEAVGEVWLRFEDDGGPGCIPLAPGDERVIGAGVTADVRVSDPTVSARHCRVVHRRGGIEVIDLSSRNGVRVAGVRVGRVMLSAGASFELGRTMVRIDPPGTAPSMCLENHAPLPLLVGNSRAMRRLSGLVRSVAPLRLPVLLRGESGTGKELVARSLHDESPRAQGPFIAINAATISRELAESELFGHRRGAFTGAARDRRGAFRMADKGTLFLDEIAALPMDVQAKLLRAVEDGTVWPLGAEMSQQVDVRLVVATCEPIETMVLERKFRADLYERLAVSVILVPPLREHSEDIATLAQHLLQASEIGRREISPGALAVLRTQRWTGNVRELRNVIVQAAVRARGPVLAEHVAAVVAERSSAARRKITPTEALRIYEDVGKNMSEAARRASLPRSTMRDLLRAAGIEPRLSGQLERVSS
jgi:transcriptional regulator with AAA-type ATPase domain